MVNPSDLMARRQRLASELNKLDELLSAFNSYASEFAPDLLNDANSAPLKAVAGTKPTQKPANGGTIESPINTMTADVVAAVMMEKNRPLTLAECEEAVRASDVPLPQTKNPRNVIGTRLHRTGRFRSTPLGWWFNDRPVPAFNEIASNGAKQNEAPNGDAAGASETGEAATSPIDKQDEFSELGLA